ncbi:DNA cytosine methyltransferase [Vibrio sp. MEBiC08052]|uniref:DNA cytosine methyltransferase n=1 Tax=Vibrio sp. MEBiC08052 TaxID=1761910 RepID=UPI0007406C56|nr:DNA cytosine methyltransferase [Vibrio sp. MEBiC08052]KUI97928.1 DNA (cytosine-5-)-methyltransferase [Vibrio sp. MEBiC08052]
MPIRVFDFFSGCGGTSRGFQQAGLELTLALDFDADAANTFRLNFPQVTFLEGDIRGVAEENIADKVESIRGPKLFCGCAPCQPFSKQNTVRPENDNRVMLLAEFQRFVERYQPEYIFLENVPGIRTSTKVNPLEGFQKTLGDMAYFTDSAIIAAQDYGVPQRRRRWVLIGSRLDEVSIPAATHGENTNRRYVTVRDTIARFPAIAAGGEHPTIPNHRAARLSELNLLRLAHTPPEQGRENWPAHLQLECHRDYNGHSDVYGRMRWENVATGLTTRCISLSNGRFGHPEQHRAISVREAAAIQTFPDDFIFTGSLNAQAKQIGNAVPVRMAQVFGEYFIAHYNQYRIRDEYGEVPHQG